jgi:hypothetical protein
MATVLVALAGTALVAAEGPQIKVDPRAGDCSSRPTVHGTGFPPNTPLELDVGLPDPSPSGGLELAVDVEFQSDAAGSFDVKASEEFGRSCLRNSVVKIAIAPDRFPDGHRADIAPVYAIFNAPGAPATGSGINASGPSPEWIVAAALSMLAFSVLVAWIAAGQPRPEVM